MSFLREDICSTPEGAKLWHQEKAILDTTEMLCWLMKQQGVSRNELAVRLGKPAGWVTRFLDGEFKMDIRTISDVLHAMGYELYPSCREIPSDV